jgi:CheY-like chemotaxis protein
MRILIADDDVTSSVMLKAMLLKRGYEAIAVFNGTEALERMQAEAFPLALEAQRCRIRRNETAYPHRV